MADLVCAGPHIAPPVIGSTDRPGVTGHGMLCVDCGAVYAAMVAEGNHPPGVIPSDDLVCDRLPGLRPAGYVPTRPPKAPSWAPAGLPWPYPARPGTTPRPT